MISIVVPVFNESPSLTQLATELIDACEPIGPFEIIFVDDGSTDQTWKNIRSLIQKDRRVKGIKLARNYGKACALNAGFEQATGDIIIQLDADLQDNPKEIPNFLAKLDDGFDLVVGHKLNRMDPLNRIIGSRIYNRVVSFLSGVHLHDHNCGFKAYRAPLLRGISLYGEMHRHIPTLVSGRGGRITEVVVAHRPRRYGQSKYGPSRALKGLLDLATVIFLVFFRQRPLHILGGVGFLACIAGAMGLVYLAFQWVWGFGIGQRPLMIYSAAALIVGFQLFATGILAELLTYYLIRPGNAYIVETVCRHDEAQMREGAGRTVAQLRAESVDVGEPVAVPARNGYLTREASIGTSPTELA